MKVMIIIRGLPGSGKSTIAEHLEYSLGVEYGKVALCEADAYFYEGIEYKFDRAKLADAHRHCYNKAEFAMKDNFDYVIVSNTSLSEGEYKRYLDLARQYDYKIQVIDVHGEFESVHGVPQEHLEKMEQRWVPFNRAYLE